MEPGSASAEKVGKSRILNLITRLLSHNLNHFIDIRLGNQRVLLCTRCTGMLLGFITSLPILLTLGIHRAPGNIVAGISICLFLPAFIYWALTRTKIVPDLNSIRVFNGFLLGMSIAAYGQAGLPIGIKIAIILLLWALVFLGNPVIGRLRSPCGMLRTEASLPARVIHLGAMQGEE